MNIFKLAMTGRDLYISEASDICMNQQPQVRSYSEDLSWCVMPEQSTQRTDPAAQGLLQVPKVYQHLWCLWNLGHLIFFLHTSVLTLSYNHRMVWCLTTLVIMNLFLIYAPKSLIFHFETIWVSFHFTLLKSCSSVISHSPKCLILL